MHWKGKGKVYPRTGYEGPRGTVDIQLYSFFNPGASCRWVVNATPRPLYRRGRDPYLFYRGLCGAHGLFGRMRKISSPPGFFFFVLCTLSVLLRPDYPSFAFGPYCTTQHEHPCPRRDLNPQSQQASGHRHSPQTPRPLGSANSIPGPSSA